MSTARNQESNVKAELLRPPIATPHWGAQGGSAFTVSASTTIDASPAAVVSTLLATSKYPDWNNFVPQVTFPSNPTGEAALSQGELRPGVLFMEHVDMHGHGKPSGLVKMKLLMTRLDELDAAGFRVVWLGKGYPDWALRSERVHNINVDANGKTTYDVWETFSGPLALFVRLFVGSTLVKRFRQWNHEVKLYTEGRNKGSEPRVETEAG
ncbi:MAG: hypothetical protein Q9222_002986 [Ikaeria aurantiellina]